MRYVAMGLVFLWCCRAPKAPLEPTPETPMELPGDPKTDAYSAFLLVWGALNPVPGGQKRCAACHSGSGPGRPSHAMNDPVAAYAEAKTAIDTAIPEHSRLYQQAQLHDPDNGVRQFTAEELELVLNWVRLEGKAPESTVDPEAPPPVDAFLEARAPHYALALSSAALRISLVPPHLAELLDVDANPSKYAQYIDAYLQQNASTIDLPLAGGTARPGLLQNVFHNPTLDPASAELALTDFTVGGTNAVNTTYSVYPSALSRLPLQWIGFGGIRTHDNPTVLNEDNFGPLDAMMSVILRDRPLREAFATNAGTDHETRACLRVPSAPYAVPTVTRQVCRRDASIYDAAPTGTPVPGGIIGSRAYQHVNYGHYKFHTVRSLFQNFHCRDFPVFNSKVVQGDDDSAARARVVAPWNQTNTSPYCASCHAASNLNLMALAFWRFDDNGVQHAGLSARSPAEKLVNGPTDIVAASVDASKHYYKDQVLDSFDAWVDAFTSDPDFIRCSAAQIYNFAMGRGSAAIAENRVPADKIDRLIADYEKAYGSANDMTVRNMLAVVFKSDDFILRAQAAEQDPCPQTPNQQKNCALLVSARRISWFGYMARWMRLFATFGVKPLAADFHIGTPEALHPSLREGKSTDQGVYYVSQYASFHALLGEPLDTFADDFTTAATFRTQHGLHITAGLTKQACRMAVSLAKDVVDAFATALPSPVLARIDTVLETQKSGSKITNVTAFKAEMGYLIYGRKLSAEELALLNGELGDLASFQRALAAAFCSTPALVE